MAASFSSTTLFRPNLNPPKSFLTHSDCAQKGFDRVKSHFINVSAHSWSSAANYASIRHVVVKSSGKRVVVKHLLLGLVKCATIEEIEAEKSSIEKDVKERMEKTIETVRANFNSIRTGRANPSMLDKVEVEYYGTPVSLKSIAQISTPESSSLLIQPFDKSSLKAIEKAIVNSDLGMTPNNDGEVIRLSLPQLTTERRKELSKVVAKQAEEGKVAVRNIRRDALKAYEKLEKACIFTALLPLHFCFLLYFLFPCLCFLDHLFLIVFSNFIQEKKLSEDNVKDLSSDLQKLTDEYMKKIDSVYKQKEKVCFVKRNKSIVFPFCSKTTFFALPFLFCFKFS
ncbi:ribosome-recycling factor, chloroplastic-like [Gossypium australe]|uniref:Ribosome-recycling factor, chloroplastic n=1 Tax=Gossypium australe TaxID=47621 RepID=A0A5B6VZF2_9ROSI|nr:ribosome-recycling factor, chloroplastic-like [Gossypium australe]